MKKNKYRFVVCMMLITLFLGGCVSEEERAQAEAWRRQAEKNAVEYIEEKYGFEATVVDSETQKATGLFSPTYTSQTLVTMEYDGKEFGVLSFGEDEYMVDASDNYQKEELLAAVEEEVNRLFGVEPDYIDMRGGDNEDATTVNGEEFYDMFFREYYDGSNLEEVLMQHLFYCAAEYVGDMDLESLYEQNKTSLFEHENFRAGFVTYDSRENMEKSVIDTDVRFKGNIYKNAMYVKDALVKDEEGVIPFDLSIGQCGDFYYLNVGVDTSQYSIIGKPEFCDADEWNGHGFRNATFTGDEAYCIEGNVDYRLYLYIPEEKYEQMLSDAGNEKVVVASKHILEKNGEEAYYVWLNAEQVPGYKVLYTNYAAEKDFSFRFMYEAGENE